MISRKKRLFYEDRRFFVTLFDVQSVENCKGILWVISGINIGYARIYEYEMFAKYLSLDIQWLNKTFNLQKNPQNSRKLNSDPYNIPQNVIFIVILTFVTLVYNDQPFFFACHRLWTVQDIHLKLYSTFRLHFCI